MRGGQQYRIQNAADEANTNLPYNAHWSPEYRAKIKAEADKEWEEISARYDALRNPLGAKQ